MSRILKRLIGSAAAASSTRGPDASRRDFLKITGAAGVGLVIGVGGSGLLRPPEAVASTASTFSANAFVRIAPDDTVSVVIKHLEMGQGVYTGLSTIVAEELDASWNQVAVETAPADATTYNNLLWGPSQGTGGSTAIANSYMQLRQAGAAAKALLVDAAAAEWGVPAAEISVSEGQISHAASGRTSGFGALTAVAAELVEGGWTAPEGLALKDPASFQKIGHSMPRLDSVEKSTGKAEYAIDVKLDGMVTAVVARPPRFGGTVASFDAADALAIPGVVAVVEIPRGVAVVAESYWPAETGRQALQVEWDDSAAERVTSADLLDRYEAIAVNEEGLPATNIGDAPGVIGTAEKTVSATYRFPFLAHAPMEPLTCVVHLTDQGCEAWAGAQIQTFDVLNIAANAGVTPETVTLHSMMAGGSFGRRATPDGDYLSEGASIAKALRDQGIERPVRLIWSREDDIRGGRYRPAYVHTLQASLDADGMPTAWYQHIVGQSILHGTPFEDFLVKDGIDMTSVEGASNLAYGVPNLRVDLHTVTDVSVPVLWWRAVGHTHTAYSTEVFLDEIARAGGQDPVALRRKLLADHPRHLGVLNKVAEMSGWGRDLGPNRGMGVAVHESFGSFVAQVAEVTIDGDDVRVDKVYCAVDCGQPINPDVIAAQMEGGIGFGLGAAQSSAIDIEDGLVVQSNFFDYEVLLMDQMPEVETHVIASTEAPTGVGEPGTPPIAPAVANAIAAVTGTFHRSMPFNRA